MSSAVDVESLYQLLNELPPDALIEAHSYLRSLKERAVGDDQELVSVPQEKPHGLSEEFLQTFGAWSNDPRTTEEIIDEIYSSRTTSNRVTSL